MRRVRLSHGVVALCVTALLGCGSTAATAAPTAAPTPVPTVAPSPTVASNGYPVPRPESNNPPSPRLGAAMAYDPQSKTILLYGGEGGSEGSARADTWSWDGTTWQQLHPAHNPPGLTGAGLVLDPTSGHLLLIGGIGALDSHGYPVQEGVWSWDGSDWTDVGSNPIQDEGVNVASDPVHHQVLVDGAGDTGAGPAKPPATYLAGAYVWNGSRFATAAAHLTGAMTVVGSRDGGIGFDPQSHRVIQFGGTQQAAFGDTLAWDGSTWRTVATQRTPDPSMPPSGQAAAATDDADQHLIVLAGYVENPAIASTWEWNGASWSRLRGTEPPVLVEPSMAYDPQIGGLVLFGGQILQASGVVGSINTTVYVWRDNGWEILPSNGNTNS